MRTFFLMCLTAVACIAGGVYLLQERPELIGQDVQEVMLREADDYAARADALDAHLAEAQNLIALANTPGDVDPSVAPLLAQRAAALRSDLVDEIAFCNGLEAYHRRQAVTLQAIEDLKQIEASLD